MNIKRDFPNDRLVSIRAKSGLNQDEFAHKVGIPERTYQAIERGVTKDPGISTVAKIAESEGLSIDYIYYGKQTPQAKSDLIVSIVSILPTLNEDQLRSVLRSTTGLSSGSSALRANKSTLPK